MHAARGGWLGQTFALAKHDDSFEGKKSGIRRSKEERKGMIEAFIKRYQSTNNGDFPSLNLTRKEVGGSFYTVREIVREIIQENRVLGPPKSPPEDQSMENLDNFLDHPSGSMPVLHVHSLHPQKTQFRHETEYVFIGDTELPHGNNEAFENVKNAELLMEQKDDELHETVTNGTQNHQMLEDVDVDKNLEQESKSTLASQKGQDPSSPKENLTFHVNGSADVKLEDALLAEQKTVNGATAQNLPNKTSRNPVQEPTLGERSANLNWPIVSSENRRTNTTLNRIDLKSWKAASNKTSGRETHQVVKFIRSLITAFVKFWSE
ncbi:uncharacterized protein LOC143592278 isoform X2 [Bidens hawaiensis]|uniref:uncharacterized protein LOC143592278 isoform X2 n=1 Tax=Bidens hawaiensis TaxID=980011 RepID=UPI00404B80F0